MYLSLNKTHSQVKTLKLPLFNSIILFELGFYYFFKSNFKHIETDSLLSGLWLTDQPAAI